MSGEQFSRRSAVSGDDRLVPTSRTLQPAQSVGRSHSAGSRSRRSACARDSSPRTMPRACRSVGRMISPARAGMVLNTMGLLATSWRHAVETASSSPTRTGGCGFGEPHRLISTVTRRCGPRNPRLVFCAHPGAPASDDGALDLRRPGFSRVRARGHQGPPAARGAEHHRDTAACVRRGRRCRGGGWPGLQPRGRAGARACRRAGGWGRPPRPAPGSSARSGRCHRCPAGCR